MDMEYSSFAESIKPVAVRYLTDLAATVHECIVAFEKGDAVVGAAMLNVIEARYLNLLEGLKAAATDTVNENFDRVFVDPIYDLLRDNKD